MRQVNVAIVGATGAVGREMTRTVEQRKFPVSKLHLVASERSRGKRLPFSGEEMEVQVLDEFSFKGIDIVLSSPGASTSREYVPRAVKEGAVVVDNTSAFRMDAEVPLVVPEANAHAIARHKGIIANPNCSTIQMIVALKPLHDEARIKRIVVSTKTDSERARISIADSGVGIPEGNLSKVFAPFFSTKPIGKGTGLGLATCQGIVTAHGGLISAENNDMGGATFIVELPLAK